jgi:hypothetical protein
MKDTYFVRNQSGILEAKEFASVSALDLLRVSDPVASNVAQGYTNASLIGDKLFTPVKMQKESGRFPSWGREAFFIPGDLKRMPGGKVARMQTQNGYVTMSLSEYAEGISIDNREKNEYAGSPDQLVNTRILQVTDHIALYRENLQAILATTTTGYASGHYISGAAKSWGGAGSGDPVSDMLDLGALVLKKNGRFPNVAFFSYGAWLLFINNTAVLNRIKYGGDSITPSQMSEKAAAQLLQVDEVVVGKSVYGSPSAPGSDGAPLKSAPTMAFLWDSVQANNVGMLIRGSAGMVEPAFGYTWERQNSPVIESYYDNATKSQVYDYEHFFDPAITLNDAGAMYYSLA